MNVPAPEMRAEVAEFQGLYGAYHVSELLLQKIWLRGRFDKTRAHTLSGERVAVLHPDTWNRLSGPDFRSARLRIGETEIAGDIEVHFHTSAWSQHGHDRDPAYANVVLHVVLFPPPAGAPVSRRSDGREIPVLALVDLLWHDLEEYASDEAVAALSSRDALPLVENLLSLDAATRTRRLVAAATDRWREKVHYARIRLERCGWEEACHLTALEVLGYRSNREAMLRVATCHPWASWRTSAGAPTVEALLAAGGDSWTRRGVRPPNQPRLRLGQYCRWMNSAPDWPLRLRARPLPACDAGGAGEEDSVVSRRRRAGFAPLREQLLRELTGGELAGQRFDTFVVNLVLPFLATRSEAISGVAEAWWRLWSPGDISEVVLDASRRLAAPGARETRTNEVVQGLLGIHLAQMRSPIGSG